MDLILKVLPRLEYVASLRYGIFGIYVAHRRYTFCIFVLLCIIVIIPLSVLNQYCCHFAFQFC